MHFYLLYIFIYVMHFRTKLFFWCRCHYINSIVPSNEVLLVDSSLIILIFRHHCYLMLLCSVDHQWYAKGNNRQLVGIRVFCKQILNSRKLTQVQNTIWQMTFPSLHLNLLSQHAFYIPRGINVQTSDCCSSFIYQVMNGN